MRRFGNKYHAKKVVFDGITFDSKKEGLRYLKLKDMEQSGEITNLERQVRFEIVPGVYQEEEIQLKTKTKIIKKCIQRPVTYIADFVYKIGDKTVVEDTKGFRTKEYELKKKLMLALLNIKITEV